MTIDGFIVINLKSLSGWAFVIASAMAVHAVEVPKTSPEVRKALYWLGGQGRVEEGREVAAAWLSQHPDDADIVFASGYLASLKATVTSDASEAKELRKQAYRAAERARQLGCTDPLIDVLVSSVDAEGRDLNDSNTLSAVPEAAAELAKGEQAFTRHDLAEAIQCYQRALQIDPRAYAAALYIGDVYFAQSQYPRAVEWFRKAITIDPDRETAHRYLGDALAKMERPKEAREEYIAAVLAAPYGRIARETLAQFARKAGRPLKRPQVEQFPASVTLSGKDVRVNVAPDSGALVLAYAVGRAKWLSEDRQRFFAKGTDPRHSLFEECAGLQLLIATAADLGSKLDEPSRKWLPSIQLLRELSDAGLLEAFVLLDAPDAGIAKDYANFRREHREILVRYINEIWFGESRVTQTSVNSAAAGERK